MSLYTEIKSKFKLESNKSQQLTQSIKKGEAFFEDFNMKRMELAFSCFSEDMKKALYEIIYFLHVNDAQYENHTFLTKKVEKVNGVLKEVDHPETVCLYEAESLAGVVGIENLCGVMQSDFNEFVQSEYGKTIEPRVGFSAIYSIASLGSIGTVGHKTNGSDLDLQVQYELFPFLATPEDFSDQSLKANADKMIYYFEQKFISQQKKKAIKAEDISGSRKVAINTFKKHFPFIFEILIKGNQEKRAQVLNDQQSCIKLADEFVTLKKQYAERFLRKERKRRETILQKKIKNIEAYVQKKYPKAEVFLFAYSNDNYRQGKHGSTLESKESSGSAYELILNYEVLMPGIQFSPVIPIHFLVSDEVNSNLKEYGKYVEYMRFHFVDLFDKCRPRLVDLGATPPLTLQYMSAHSGAIYWESFKASSGNLPKALLNLLRLEMLFDQRFNTTIIDLVKNPKRFDHFIEDIPVPASEEKVKEVVDEYNEDHFYDTYGIPEIAQSDQEEDNEIFGEDETSGGIPLAQLIVLESKFPMLLKDPWWIRYKVLKIGFGAGNQTIENDAEKDLLSRIIDLAFALHVKISEIFQTKPGKKEDLTYRDSVLIEFLERAFPKSRRRYLEHIFMGDTQDVNRFEKELKILFKNSMKRVNLIVENQPGRDQSNQEEFSIWYHYYQQNFEPARNVVKKDTLTHLRVPKGRLQIGFNSKKKTWFFRSLQKNALATSNYNTFGEVDNLPELVELLEHRSFLHGIAHCIMNGYYGVYNKGTLLENRTHLEFSVGQMSTGKASADKWAYLRPDSVDRLFDAIDKAFPYQDYDYRDCIYKKREVVNIFIALNMLEYGRLSFLYRDNLKVWFVDMIDHPPIEKLAGDSYDRFENVLYSPIILNSIKDFFKKHEFEYTLQSKHQVKYWVNPNSFKTFHGADKPAEKEAYLAKLLDEAVMKVHDLEGKAKQAAAQAKEKMTLGPTKAKAKAKVELKQDELADLFNFDANTDLGVVKKPKE